MGSNVVVVDYLIQGYSVWVSMDINIHLIAKYCQHVVALKES